jgi:hypothetical protein
MAIDTPEMQAILQRIERLEADNRRLRRAMLGVALLAAVVLAMGQARPRRTVEADEFVLRDKAGRKRALLGFDSSGHPSLTFYAENSNFTASLDGADEASLILLGAGIDEQIALEAGKSVHGLSILAKGAVARIWAIGSKAEVSVTDVTHKTGVIIEDRELAPRIGLTDADGFETRIGSADLVTPRTGDTHTTSAASLVLSDKNDKILWRAP